MGRKESPNTLTAPSADIRKFRLLVTEGMMRTDNRSFFQIGLLQHVMRPCCRPRLTLLRISGRRSLFQPTTERRRPRIPAKCRLSSHRPRAVASSGWWNSRLIITGNRRWPPWAVPLPWMRRPKSQRAAQPATVRCTVLALSTLPSSYRARSGRSWMSARQGWWRATFSSNAAQITRGPIDRNGHAMSPSFLSTPSPSNERPKLVRRLRTTMNRIERRKENNG